jgi:IclR family acetate operon transcriptional repressor
MGPSNAHRLLSVLTELGYVRQQGARGGYFATPWLSELGAAVTERIDLRQVLAPQLEALNRVTEEAVSISVWRDGGTTLVARVESRYPARIYTRLGSRIPSHLTAGGLVLLAHRPQPEIDKYVAEHFAPAPDRRDTVSALHRRLASVREERVARVRGTWIPGLCGIAVPLFHAGEVAAAIHVSGPAERLTDDRLDAILVKLREAVAGMEPLLGGGFREGT